MSLDFTEYDEAHPLGNIGDICFLNGKLVSVADDSLLKIFSVQNNALKLD